MKAIFMVDMPKSCLECEFCGYIADIKDGFRSCFLNKHCFEERDAETSRVISWHLCKKFEPRTEKQNELL